MLGRNDVTDKALLKSVERRLERTGMKSKLSATMRQGTVTISGQLQYEKQRMQIMNAVKGVSGVRQVVDQLKSPPKAKPQPAHQAAHSPAAPSPSETVADEANEQVAEDPTHHVPVVPFETVAGTIYD